jgi:hypothetical protein
MTPYITTILILISTFTFGQVTTKVETVIVDSGKYEFKIQAKKDTPNYSVAFRILTNQVKLKPYDAELRYFLGYTIDRLNADDGKGMSLLKKEMSIKASEQFEEVNRLEPIYKGEKINLDPYAKITSIWGSLAESYLNKNLKDSAIWAFEEGKRRGGFMEPVLSFNRQLLKNCSQNAILITFGDIVTIPLWYLQTIEKFRLDVTVVDANLINTTWYPKYLKRERKLKISFNNSTIDTLDYIFWKPTEIKIVNPKNKTEKLTWTLNPSYLDNYILKGDRILLDIFKQNYFNRDIYFNSNSNTSYNLYLGKYFIDEGILDKVSLRQTNKKITNIKNYSIDNLKSFDILKSSTSINLLGGYRWTYFAEITNQINKQNFKMAKELLTEMKHKFSVEKLPFATKQEEDYSQQLTDVIDQNFR